jgi:hypothetical protein
VKKIILRKKFGLQRKCTMGLEKAAVLITIILNKYKKDAEIKRGTRKRLLISKNEKV